MMTNGRVDEELQRRGVSHWLFLYARDFCRECLTLQGEKIKGKNHAPRREINPADPFLSLLPHAYVSRPKPGTISAIAHTRRKVKNGFTQFRVVLDLHYDRLRDALLAVGYDLDRSRIVSPEAYTAADAYYSLQREPIPFRLAWQNLTQAENGLSTLERIEDLDLFRRIQS